MENTDTASLPGAAAGGGAVTRRDADPEPRWSPVGTPAGWCSRRLRVEALDASTATAVAELVRDPRVYASYYLGPDEPPGSADEQDWAPGAAAEGRARPVNFAVRLRASNELIGALRLRGNRISFLIAPPHWGQGLASELVAGACGILPARYRLDHLEAEVLLDNQPSRRVLEGQGFRCVGPVEIRVPGRSSGIPALKYVCRFPRP
jgi:RimJ/RimL family protein N-acetyltransferase